MGRDRRGVPLAGLIFGVGIAVAAVAVLWKELAHLDLTSVYGHLRSYSTETIAAGVLLVVVYAVVNAVNEAWIVRVLGLRIRGTDATVIAAIANPIGHALGFSTLTAGALRYRLYSASGIPPRAIAAVIAVGTLPFLFAAVTLLAWVLLVDSGLAAPSLHVAPAVLQAIGALGLVAVVAMLVAANTQTARKVLGWATHGAAPGGFGTGFLFGQLAVGVLEVILVAAILHVFLPKVGPSFAGFLGVYLIAVVLGQLSASPAGLGVLEASLLVLLPQVNPSSLLAGILAYRVLFELLPLSAGLLLWAAREIRGARVPLAPSSR
jgi:phosphatidylglycerol lysyltransferase